MVVERFFNRLLHIVIFLIRKYTFILVVIISLFPLLDLTHPGYFIGHDTKDHIARVANFYANLEEGNFIPRWAGNLNWGYGHPILMFLYPFPSYLASLFHLIGFSFVDSVKLVFVVSYVLSGISMYVFIKSLWGKKAGIVASVLYLYAPYRFVDLYVRGAIGEHVFFIFPPILLWLIYMFAKTKSLFCFIGTSFIFAFMILSHNALSIMYLPVVLLWSFMWFFYYFRTNIKEWIMGSLSLFLGLSVSSFFWIPAFFEGKYTLRDIVTGNEIFSRFETFNRLLYSSWNYGGTGQFSVQVGIIQWAMIFLAPIIIYVMWKKYEKKLPVVCYLLLFAAYIFFWLAIFLILPISKPIYQTFTILQKFQFPWRWLSLAIFPPAIFAGATIFLTPKKYKLLLVIFYLLSVTFLNRNYWYAKGYSYKPDSYYTGVYYGTTDTGESSPIWSVRFMEKKPSSHAKIVEGEGHITEVKRLITKRVYRISSTSDKVRVLENTLYFPNWTVYIDGKRVPLYDIWWQDPQYRGLINFFVPKGTHTVVIQFENTKLRTIADTISLVSFIILFGLTIIYYLHFKSYD